MGSKTSPISRLAIILVICGGITWSFNCRPSNGLLSWWDCCHFNAIYQPTDDLLEVVLVASSSETLHWISLNLLILLFRLSMQLTEDEYVGV